VSEINASKGLKHFLGRIPFTAELAQILRPVSGDLPCGYRLDQLTAVLPDWIESVSPIRQGQTPYRKKRLLILASLRWWLEYGIALGLLLSGLGHDVDLAYIPYRKWWEPAELFDLRRHRYYLQRGLAPLKGLLKLRDLSTYPNWSLSEALAHEIDEQSRIDVQYTLQRETISVEENGPDHALYLLRQRRNRVAANAALQLLPGNQFDAVIIPNGSILEFGAFYRVARHLEVPAVTIEFGEQRERIWLAQNDEVMRLDTSDLWKLKKDFPLSEWQLEEVKTLYQARRGGKVWANFGRQWQSGKSEGASAVLQELELNPEKPIALLCTNVVGDSLALGRQIFTSGMADWLAKTVQHFAKRSDVQIVVRVHPGEMLGAGHPSVEIVQQALSEMPPHVFVVPPDSRINTYDLIELAHIGMVYTTTVGLEMAMSGIPVVVSGMTHYRNKGFTYDPMTMSEYFATVDQLLREPIGRRIPQEKIDLSWTYAYRFFFEYPFPFPWHLIHFWSDIQNRPIEHVLSDSTDRYARTIDAFLGIPIDWNRSASI
jgi:hypothetical protein